MRRLLAVTAGLQLALSAVAGDPMPALIPRPVTLDPNGTAFVFTPDTTIVVEDRPEVRALGELLATQLAPTLGRTLRVAPLQREQGAPGDHLFLSTRNAAEQLGPEGYLLEVTSKSAALVAQQPAGLARGSATLRQLLQQVDGRWQIPGVRVRDFPRYRWRGMLIDCGRHFVPLDVLKRYVDLLAYHKFNVLHWHLTEDQGWRIEIRKYPRLTEVGAWRTATRDTEQPRDDAGRYGGFYTQDQVRELVEYARQRYVTIVPEIELPGHCQAALAAYPGLSCTGGPFEVSTKWGVHDDVYCAGNDEVFRFLEDVLSEVVELFPSEYVHIGGDEVPKTRWKACPKCQARLQAEGLKDEHELQSYFVRRVEKILNARGKRLIGWDEILEGGLAPNATVQSWRGMQGAIAAARAGHDVISSPTSHCYINFPQVPDPAMPDWMELITLEKIYGFEPTPAELTGVQAAHILGAEGNLWTEVCPPERIDEQAWPRLCALAEVTWSQQAARDFADFSRRLETHYRRLDALGVSYSKPPTASAPRP